MNPTVMACLAGYTFKEATSPLEQAVSNSMNGGEAPKQLPDGLGDVDQESAKWGSTTLNNLAMTDHRFGAIWAAMDPKTKDLCARHVAQQWKAGSLQFDHNTQNWTMLGGGAVGGGAIGAGIGGMVGGTQGAMFGGALGVLGGAVLGFLGRYFKWPRELLQHVSQDIAENNGKGVAEMIKNQKGIPPTTAQAEGVGGQLTTALQSKLPNAAQTAGGGLRPDTGVTSPKGVMGGQSPTTPVAQSAAPAPAQAPVLGTGSDPRQQLGRVVNNPAAAPAPATTAAPVTPGASVKPVPSAGVTPPPAPAVPSSTATLAQRPLGPAEQAALARKQLGL